MRMVEHLILLGETMMILMSISGKLYFQGCRISIASISHRPFHSSAGPVIASSLAGHGGQILLSF